MKPLVLLSVCAAFGLLLFYGCSAADASFRQPLPNAVPAYEEVQLPMRGRAYRRPLLE